MHTAKIWGSKVFTTQSEVLFRAFNLVKVPILISFVITPIRFFLELSGLPENIIFIVGLLWLTLAISIYWGVKLYKANRPLIVLLISLCIFSPISRIPVFILWWIDTNWEIGSHYGLFYDSWGQALISHVVGGAIVQIIPGLIVGYLTIVIMQLKKSRNKLT